MPASVSSERLGSEAMVWLRSRKPGIVRPAAVISGFQARTPLMATNAICMPSLDRCSIGGNDRRLGHPGDRTV